MKRFPLLCIAFFACTCAHRPSDRPPETKVPSPCGVIKGALNAVTYNTAMAPGMNMLSTPRLPAVSEALSRLDYDVLCLEEVWPDQAVETIAKATGLPRKNIVYADNKGMNESGEDICQPGQLGGVESCVREKCKGLPAEEITICALSQCRSKLLYLHLFDKKCLNCLAASVGKDIDQIIDTCTPPGGSSRIYGGNNGIMLVSKWPILEKEILQLPASSANKVALFARLKAPWGGSVEVACTHLSSPQEIAPTNPRFRSWEEEQAEQFRLTAARLAARAGNRPQIFLGDMNFGRPNGNEISGQHVEVWNLAFDLGFSSPAAYATPPLCSGCAKNSFRNGGKDYLIDHVMLRDPRGGIDLVPVCAEQVFTDLVTVEHWEGRPAKVHRSDHFGIRVKFRVK